MLKDIMSALIEVDDVLDQLLRTSNYEPSHLILKKKLRIELKDKIKVLQDVMSAVNEGFQLSHEVAGHADSLIKLFHFTMDMGDDIIKYSNEMKDDDLQYFLWDFYYKLDSYTCIYNAIKNNTHIQWISEKIFSEMLNHIMFRLVVKIVVEDETKQGGGKQKETYLTNDQIHSVLINLDRLFLGFLQTIKDATGAFDDGYDFMKYAREWSIMNKKILDPFTERAIINMCVYISKNFVLLEEFREFALRYHITRMDGVRWEHSCKKRSDFISIGKQESTLFDYNDGKSAKDREQIISAMMKNSSSTVKYLALRLLQNYTD